MTMNRVLLPLTRPATASSAIETAIAATRILQGRVDALYIANGASAAPAVATGVPVGEWRMATAAMTAVSDDAETGAERRDRDAERLRESFRQACADAGITLVATDEEGRAMVAHWDEVAGSALKLVVEQSARHDLVVSPGSASNGDARELAEAALLRAQRPVLLAPSRLHKPLDGVVVIAWEESPECWAAVTAAMPFLAVAEAVEIVSIDKDRERPKESQRRLQDYLSERGVEAEAKVADPLSRPVGQAILSEASDRGAGLLVMGAYSHSPLREFFFGGATREVLKNAAATPVLMAH